MGHDDRSASVVEVTNIRMSTMRSHFRRMAWVPRDFSTIRTSTTPPSGRSPIMSAIVSMRLGALPLERPLEATSQHITLRPSLSRSRLSDVAAYTSRATAASSSERKWNPQNLGDPRTRIGNCLCFYAVLCAMLLEDFTNAANSPAQRATAC